MYERILIIGCSGSGKSTLSHELHRLLKIPVVHLDALYWLPKWKQKEKQQFVSELTTELQQPRWIIDGNFDSTLDLRMKYADFVIFLDYKKHVCMHSVLKRYFMYKGKTRPDMGTDCQEKIDVEFLRYIWTFDEHSRPNILKNLQKSSVNSIVFKNRSELKHWLVEMEKKLNEKLV